ncbi:MAG: ribonuclease P protein component [Planctomycetota bacterium]|nr:MAG: ribonuclease P protein component [Planctomycetota bacterium]
MSEERAGSEGAAAKQSLHPAAMSERLPRWMRLKRDSDFERILKTGKRLTAKGLVVYALQNGLPYPRLGLRVAKRIGTAVRRNYLKRCVREVFRRWLKKVLAGVDIVVVVTADGEFAQIKEGLLKVAALLSGWR